MSFAWMRRIDSWIGKPLVRVLGLFTPKAVSLYGEGEPQEIPRRVVCAKFIGLGSIVLSLPLLKALKAQGVRIAFWSFEGQADLVRLSGLVDEIYIIRPTLKGLVPSLWRSWRQVRRFKPDAFFDLEPTANFSAILARISGARTRVGFICAKPFREQIFTHLVSLTSERHMIENNLWMGRRLRIDGPEMGTLPPLPALEHIRNVLPDLPGRKRIVVNINSSDLSWHRMWPEENWVALCNRLLEDHRVDLIFPGTASERDRVQNLVFKLKDPTRVFNIAGETFLVELLKLLHESKLVVSVDSGIMHMAAWAGSPLVALFGPETPRLFGPRSTATILWAGLPCSPCLSVAADKVTRCRDNQCLKQISTDAVFQACRKLLFVMEMHKNDEKIA